MSQTFRFIIINLKFLLEYVCMQNIVKLKRSILFLRGSLLLVGLEGEGMGGVTGYRTNSRRYYENGTGVKARA